MIRWFGVSLMMLAVAQALPVSAEQPNILLIVFDDLNTDPTHDPQSPFLTPNLDALARQSMSFTRAVANVPVCNPSRASFLSGLLPTRTGAYLNGSDAWNKEGSVLRDIVSLPEHFRQQGYFTWGAGKLFHSPLTDEQKERIFSHLVRGPNGFGPFGHEDYPFIRKGESRFGDIQAWLGPDEDFPDTLNANAAIDFLQQSHEQPFFMMLGLWRPHSPYTSPARFFEAYEPGAFQPPSAFLENDLEDVPEEGRLMTDGLDDLRGANGRLDPERWQQKLWGYAAGTSFADWNMGRVLDALEASGHADNTLVIVTSDNGFHLGDKNRWGKGTLWQRAAAVPLLVSGPGVAAGSNDAPVSLVDLFPTLVDYTNIALPKHTLDGSSMVPWFGNTPPRDTRPNFFAYGKHNAGVGDERWHYIRYHDGSEELYDLRADPWEQQNLASDSDTLAVKTRLAEHIPATWAPSVGGRREVKRAGEPDFFPNENAAAGDQKPNFIIVLTDDQGYGDLGVQGSPDIRTPELDRMAAEGLRFTQFYVASSVCSASRAALLSGQRGAVNGVEGVFWPSQEGMSPSVLTLAELLRPAGYATALYGKWHLGDQPHTRPLAQGFDEYFGIPYSNDMYVSPEHQLAESVRFGAGYSVERFRADQATVRDWTGERWELKQGVNGAVPLLEGDWVVEYPANQASLTQRYFARAHRFISQNANRPFFLFISPAMPHVPLFASENFAGNSDRGLYGDVIEEIDFEMGRLRQHLEDLGLAKNTLLIYTSDNGPWLDKGEDGGSAGGLRAGKFTNFEGGVRVPAIMAWPGTVPGGAVSTEVSSTLDLFPTLAELAGVQIPKDYLLDGQAIVRHLREPSTGIPREDYFYNLGGDIAGIRHGDWKYLRAGRASRQEKTNSYQPLLFDLAEDPAESVNLAEQHPWRVEQLEARIRTLEK